MSKEVWIQFGIGCLGFLIFHVQQADSMRKDAEVANMKFNIFDDYIKRDALGLISSLLTIVAYLTFAKEIQEQLNWLKGSPRLSAFVVGGVGSYGSQLLFNRSKKLLRTAIDVKTNIADKKTDVPLTTLTEVNTLVKLEKAEAVIEAAKAETEAKAKDNE